MLVCTALDSRTIDTCVDQDLWLCFVSTKDSFPFIATDKETTQTDTDRDSSCISRGLVYSVNTDPDQNYFATITWNRTYTPL